MNTSETNDFFESLLYNMDDTLLNFQLNEHCSNNFGDSSQTITIIIPRTIIQLLILVNIIKKNDSLFIKPCDILHLC